MIDKRTLVGIASLATLSLAWQPLSAGTIRCSGTIIQDGGRSGPGKYEVLKKCGEPAFRQGNTWVYERGGGRRKVVRFNDAGLLISIRDPGR